MTFLRYSVAKVIKMFRMCNKMTDFFSFTSLCDALGGFGGCRATAKAKGGRLLSAVTLR